MPNKISKRDYRCHAHTNPFKDTHMGIPDAPEEVNWSSHFTNGQPPTYIDVGCGYGKFLMETAKISPSENVLGIEIRDKVFEFVNQLTNYKAGTTNNEPTDSNNKNRCSFIDNCSVIRSNALLFMPNYFKKDSLKKIFVLFPDPHFKKRKQKGRVICKQMMQVFKYLLKVDGELYVSTDVEELFKDMCEVITASGYFVEQKDVAEDPLFDLCYKGTDEAGRAGVKSGHTFGRVFRVLK